MRKPEVPVAFNVRKLDAPQVPPVPPDLRDVLLSSQYMGTRSRRKAGRTTVLIRESPARSTRSIAAPTEKSPKMKQPEGSKANTRKRNLQK